LPTEGTAYHEAGHMVAAWDLGLSVAGATIVPDPEAGYLGRVRVPLEARVRYADWVDEDGYLYAHLVAFLAGPLASEQHTGAALPPEDVQLGLESLGSDHYNTADLLLSLAGPNADAQVEVGDRAQRHAEFLVLSRWERIEAVARVLIEREALDEAECRQVLGDAFGR
jgi:hypothetical protein